MNKFKFLTAGFLAMGLVGAASAQTVIRITGSTAYRNAAEQSIQVALASGYVWGGVGKTVGSTQLIFSGNLASGGDPVIILTSFTGSEGGIDNLTHPGFPPSNATYIAHDAAHLSHLTTAGYTGFTSADTTDLTTADIAFGDTFQSSSAYKTPSLSDTKVGIVPFLWVASASNPDPITNITHQQAKAALAGVATYALWNNSSADRSVAVDVIGRDQDSGTRDNTFLESGYGNTTAPVQWAPTGSPTSASNPTGYSGFGLYPANTVNGISYPAGQSGYSSGGSVATAVQDPSIANAAGAEIIGYIGTSDAYAGLQPITITGVGSYTNLLTPISWEGVSFATAGQSTYTTTYNEAAITSGQYTFWSYEHLFTVTGTLNADVATLKAALVNELLTGTEIVNQHSGYNLSDIVNAGIARATDGAPVFFNN